MKVTAKQFLESIQPGDVVYAAVMIERFDSSRRTVGKHIWRLFHAGYLERTSAGHYKRTAKVWEKAPYTPRGTKPKAVQPPKPKKPKKPKSVEPVVPSLGIVDRAIASRHALASVWGGAHA